MTDLQADVRAALAGAAVPADAEPMRAYMKSDLPFHGVKKPARQRALRPVLDRHVFDDRAAWEEAIRRLVVEATHREEWYAALSLLRHRRYQHWHDHDVLPLVRAIAEAARWWDVVDGLANVVGAALDRDPDMVAPILRGWAEGDDLWLRRLAIIAQLGRRDRTDTDLLVDTIGPSLDSEEFFLRKAIGWALRQYARTDPDWVIDFVLAHRLSSLSRREALKHLGDHPRLMA